MIRMHEQVVWAQKITFVMIHAFACHRCGGQNRHVIYLSPRHSNWWISTQIHQVFLYSPVLIMKRLYEMYMSWVSIE